MKYSFAAFLLTAVVLGKIPSVPVFTRRRFCDEVNAMCSSEVETAVRELTSDN